MQKVISRVSLIVLFLLSLAPAGFSAKLQSNSQLETIAKLTATMISSRHYSQRQLDDDMSSKIFDEYLKTIDSSKMFFTQQDIKLLNRYRYSLDDQIMLGSLDFAFLVYKKFIKRYQEYCEFAKVQLDKGFDFTINEDFQFDRSKAKWPADEKEMKDLWRKRLKNAMLSQKLMDRAMKLNEKNGKKSPNAEKYRKLWSQKSAKEKLEKRMEQTLEELKNREPIEILSIYLTSLTKIYDPHSSYMSPKEEESFNINMKLSLVGIGAVLSSEDGYTKIVKLIPGGPAEKDGKLKPEDRIIAVAQDGEEPVDILDMPLNKVVQLIRGKKNTKVNLTILAGDKGQHAIPKVITIVRNKVELKDQAASGRIEKIKGADGKEKKIGIIVLPSFYIDFAAAQRGDRNYKSSTRDVAKILTDFSKKGVDGIVLDLRSNGGGSLQEAITLTGLFIESGPVVQIKDGFGRIMVNNDTDPAIQYSGPMAVLINKLSASATEIFAGAIKDYNRGIILGDRHTHGKGTVQMVYELSDLLNMFGVSFNAGSIKFTNAKFYRINGHSTQLKGVSPHIVFPSYTDSMKIGEIDIDYALPWDAIKSVPHKNYDPELSKEVNVLKQKSDKRLNSNIKFKVLKNDIAAFDRINSKKLVSLNVEKRWKEYLAEKKFKEQQDKLLKLDDRTKSSQTSDYEKEDIYMQESLNILSDFIDCKKVNKAQKIASRKPAEVTSTED